MRSWIREYGLADSLTQELINVTPQIARFISLTYTISEYDVIQQNMSPDGSYILPYPEDVGQAINDQENTQLEEAWLILENDFVEGAIDKKSIIDVCKWIPEILIPSIEATQELPILLQKSRLNWDFIAAALIPVLETEPTCESTQNLVISLREQVFSALIHERANVYTNYKTAQEEDRYSYVKTPIYQPQTQLLNTIMKSSTTEVTARINILLDVLKTMELVDCIILVHVISTLSNYTFESISSNVIDNLFRNHTALIIGQYLFDLKNKKESDLRVLGSISDVWEKLIDLLFWESQENKNVEGGTQADQWLVQFLKRFQNTLLPDWWLRRKLYRVGKSTKYRKFRRILFTELVQHQELLPTGRNDESELLVQVLVELWDSDYTWLINSQSRLSDLRTLLGQLQEIDAVGARRLADQIANSLANPSN